MNKKRWTLLFILAGTLINILLMVTCFILFLVIYSRFLHLIMPESGLAWVLAILFLAALAVSFFIYRFLVKFILKKTNIHQTLSG